MNRTYIRKCKGGWKVVHVSNESDGAVSHTIVAPLSKEEAIAMRATFTSMDASSSDVPDFEAFLKTWGEPSTHEPF